MPLPDHPATKVTADTMPTQRGRSKDAAPDKITIYDVAQQAGVSIATVSHVLNKPEKVATATLERVLRVMDELNFTPKQTAVSLARRGVGRIGVLAPFTSYGSYSLRLNGVLEACADRNIDVLVFDVPSVASADTPLMRSLPVTGRLDGLLIMGVPLEDALARRLAHRKLATVLVDSRHEKFNWVNIDDEAGGHQVATHLIERGHRSFAYVSEGQRSTEYVSPGQLRRRGIARALQAAGFGEDALRQVTALNTVRGGREAAQAIAAGDAPPTAVIAHSDELAAGLVAGFRAADVRVPQDIAVAGYDDTALAEAMELTSVHQALDETGRLAAQLLLDMLQSPARHIQHLTLAPSIVVRATT